MHTPQIFQYLDFRVFLGEWFAWKKEVDPGFSLRTFARVPDLGLSSSSFLSAVLKGRKNLSQGLRLKFGRALGLQAGELEYFELLVQFNQAKSADERNHYFAHLSKFHSSRARILDEPKYSFFSRWYYRVVWNYFALHQDQNNPAQIAKAVFPAISPSEADEAIRVLLELRLIKRLANGYAITDRHLATGKRFPGAEAARHQREMLQLALDNLERVPVEARQYNAMSFSISERGFGRIRERMDAFRAELRELVEADEGGDRILALSMQLFPCSRRESALSSPPAAPQARHPSGAPARSQAGRGGASSDTGNPEGFQGPAIAKTQL